MSTQRFITLFKAFILPVVVLLGLIIYLFLYFFKIPTLSVFLALFLIAIGSYPLLKESYEDLKVKNFGLDYIAILAILVALITQEFLVGIVIALMLATGRKLEEYGATSAKRTLTNLAQRIPHDILVEKNGQTETMSVSKIKKGEIIVIRKGEVIPLDGILVSKKGTLDESSLTGEAYPVDKEDGESIRSGTINLTQPIKVKVTNDQENSSYTKIVNLVQRAQAEKAPLVRLADRYSLWFTLITFAISGFAYFQFRTLESILAVLVVATPCPLILATPIALIGGMDKSAKKRAIVKKLSSIEVLARVNSIVFDKTGTITLGKPVVARFEIAEKSYEEKELISIASSIERNSLHPLAKSIVEFAENKKVTRLHASQIHETAGLGIEGSVEGKEYALSKISNDKSPDMVIGLFQNKNLLASFTLEDQIKENTKSVIEKLKNQGLEISLFTGDRREVAKKLIEKLGIDIDFRADLKPEDKGKLVKVLQEEKHVVAMVGDGINDAPALALADVGMVFSNEEQTAASEAADIVFLGGNFSSVLESYQDARNTVRIAKQSIVWGIGMSVVAMVAASFGLIPPIAGAVLQEGIDVVVILNALRASR